jgi:tRNA modification GTPase
LLGDKARDWRAQIVEACALIEAGIDFSDEGDVPAELTAPALAKIKVLLGEIRAVLDTGSRSERLRDGLLVAIAGPPNVGKSTLINQLARREIAIVSPHAGTTRDVIEAQLDLDGYPVTVIDTAGIRETNDPVEQEGVRRAQARAAEADLVLWVTDAESEGIAQGSEVPIWLVHNKIDLHDAQLDTPRSPQSATREFRISARRGDGVAELVSAMIGFAQDYFGANESGLISRERQRRLLQETADSLQRSIDTIDRGEEFVAENLRMAAYALGRLLGRVDVEDILDVIFREFCIGK